MCTDSASLGKSKWSLIVRALSALRPNSREQEAERRLCLQWIRLLLLEVAVQLGLDEDDSVEELLHDFVLVCIVLRGDLLLLDCCFFVYGCLSGLSEASML